MNPDTEPTVAELFDLRGKRALVTGASGHLGGALARALAEAGATVVVSSRDLARAEAVLADLPNGGGASHRAVQLDHMDEPSLFAGFAAAVDAVGGLEILVNNGHEPLAADWTDVTAEQFSRHLRNATGYFLLARQMREHAVARQTSASVIMLGSMYGTVGSYPEVYRDVSPVSPAAYHALKGGIVHLARHLAVCWAPDGVRVNCLSPGPFPSDKAPAELVRRLCDRSPMRRMGQPHELKGAVVFLASDASSYMTGQNLVIDGGWTAW
jgi:NAD(P)-dependent dehydrogenase (short-subunit alcohol dehydrogenase family)